MLSKLWSRFFAGENCFEKMRLDLQALVLKSDEVKFARKGVESFQLTNFKTQQLNLLVCTISGSQTIVVEADPRESVASVCSDFSTEYEIAAINGLTLFSEDLLDLCFEDLADDTLTLTLTALKRHSKRRKLGGESITARVWEVWDVWEDDEALILGRVWEAYQKELAAPIYLKEGHTQPTEPFLVADVMADPIDLFMPGRVDIGGIAKRHQEPLQ